MTREEELKKIKKLYGEEFMKLCRTQFPTLLEQEGVLLKILQDNFALNARTLGQDIKSLGRKADFKSFVYAQYNAQTKDNSILEANKDKTPYELLDEAGYTLFECTSEKEIQSFKKYYAPGEELCTFNGDRLDDCVVFFAVKKDLDDIRREDFTNPDREDKYSTSVLGIQFNREGICTVSIKSRYNHTVGNPDATYGNNLEKISPGLTQSFTKLLKERGLELDSSNIDEFDLRNYVVAGDGKHYKYNMEVGGKYYCPGNIVIENGEVTRLGEPEKRLLIDTYVLDLENKKIYNYDDQREDAFVDGLQDIKRIDVVKDKESHTKKISIQFEDDRETVKIELDGENNIAGYDNKNLTELGTNFMHANKGLKQLDTPGVQKVRNGCLTRNRAMQTLNLTEVESIGDYCFSSAYLNEINTPKLRKIGNASLMNPIATELEFQNLEKIGDRVFESACYLEKFVIPHVTVMGEDVLKDNDSLKVFEAPNLQTVGDGLLEYNESLERMVVPKSVTLSKKWKKIRVEPTIDKNKEQGLECNFQEQAGEMANTRSARGIKRVAEYIRQRIKGQRDNLGR